MMNTKQNMFTAILFVVVSLAGAVATADSLHAYNVVWDSPSTDCHGSMPIGNGDLAANVWVEPNGDLVFYLSKSDAWSSTQDLLKLGKVRVRLDKPLIIKEASFKQELDLATGTIRIQSEVGSRKSKILFWIDAHNSVVNVEIMGSEAFSAQVTLEPWRIVGQPLRWGAVADSVLPAEGDVIRWFQRNQSSIFAETLTQQHLGALVDKYPDPLINRTFGGIISGAGLQSKDAKTLVTKAPVKTLHFRAHALTAQTGTAQEWIDQIEKQRELVEALSLSVSRKQHEAYWVAFWSRSHIFVGGASDAEDVTRAYVLQRWIQACAGRGAYPIKFNGSLFTVDGNDRGRDFGPDYRRWRGWYWFQNTRLIYWPMLYSGDFDQMKPFWNLYRDALSFLKERTQTYFKHDGAHYSESMYLWGLYRKDSFGEGFETYYPVNGYMRYNWDCGLELSLMMLDYYAHQQNEDFVRNTLLPVADAVVTFYDRHYERNAAGKIHIAPSMALETWWDVENPMPVVAGLTKVLAELLKLPEGLATDEQRKGWSRFFSELPEIPTAGNGTKKWLTPAQRFAMCRNGENPDLYAVFPYRLYGMGMPDLDVGQETWFRRKFKDNGGWHQHAIQAAMLGLTKEACELVVQNATVRAPHGTPAVESRFPAFWGPNFDWTPDQCHGSVTMIALQRMLMLCDGDNIHLLPAWPKEWNADFKLHAPQNTTVEGRVENGKLFDLKVTPKSRRKDVVVEEIK